MIKPLSEWSAVWRKTISSIDVVEQIVGAGSESEK